MTAALHERAVLVDLTISVWSARKHDSRTTREVNTSKQATNGGRFHKRLMDNHYLADVNAAATHLRNMHNEWTVAWNDAGMRLLPVHRMFDYRREMGALRTVFEKAVAELLLRYDQLVSNERVRMGALFQPTDYPTAEDLRKKFKVTMETASVPEIGDFRTDVSSELRAELQQEVADAFERRSRGAVIDTLRHAKEHLERMDRVLSAEKPRITRSLLEDTHAMVSRLNILNLFDNRVVSGLARDLEGLGMLRRATLDSPWQREEVQQVVRTALQNTDWEPA